MENKEVNIDSILKNRGVDEVGYHIISSVAMDHLGERVTAIRDVIEAVGGLMIADEYPKQMELAYPILKVASIALWPERVKMLFRMLMFE